MRIWHLLAKIILFLRSLATRLQTQCHSFRLWENSLIWQRVYWFLQWRLNFVAQAETEMNVVIKWPLWRVRTFWVPKQVQFAYETEASRQVCSISYYRSYALQQAIVSVPCWLVCGLNSQAVWVSDLHTLALLYSKMNSKCKFSSNCLSLLSVQTLKC